MIPGDMVLIDTKMGDYDGYLGLVISQFTPYYFKVFVSGVGFRFYQENHVQVIQ
jgi:hypothetical protein